MPHTILREDYNFAKSATRPPSLLHRIQLLPQASGIIAARAFRLVCFHHGRRSCTSLYGSQMHWHSDGSKPVELESAPLSRSLSDPQWAAVRDTALCWTVLFARTYVVCVRSHGNAPGPQQARDAEQLTRILSALAGL